MTDSERDGDSDHGRKLGYQGEVYADIQHVSNENNAFATGAEGQFEDEPLMLGQLSVCPGDRVPVIPLSDNPTVTYDSESARVAICTDRTFWSPRYFRHLKNPSGVSRSKLNDIKSALIKRDVIPHRNVFSHELESNTESIPLAEDAPTNLPVRYAPQLLDTDPDIGDTVKGVLNRVTRHGKAVVTINASEYTLREDTSAVPGDTLLVRVIDSRTVITPEQPDDVDVEPNGHPRECQAQVYDTTTSDNTRVIGIDDDINGTTYLTGPLTVPIGAHVPTVPLRSKQNDEDYAVCTASEVWGDEYRASMARLVAPSEAQITDLRAQFRKITRTEQGASLEMSNPDSGELPAGAVVRFSNNGNAVISIDGREYTLRDDVEDLDVGDIVTVAVENKTFVHLASQANANPTQTDPQRDAENDVRDTSTGNSSADADATGDDNEAGGADDSEPYNMSRVESTDTGSPTSGSESGESSFSSGQTADGEVQRIEHDGGDATVVVAVDGEEYTVRETQEDGADIAVEGGTQLMHSVTELDVGDTVTVRRVDASHVTLHGYQSDIAVDDAHSNVEKEAHVQVFEYTDNGYAYGIGTEGDLNGDIVFLGSLTCPRNTHVAAKPMDASVRGNKVAVCTDPAFWGDAYTAELARITSIPLSRLESVCLDIGAEPPNDSAKPRENVSKSSSSDGATAAESLTQPSLESSGTATGASHSNESQHSSPELTEDEESFITARRRERDQAFAHKVKDAYHERCGVCGERRVAPNGSMEVEAAHIYPKSEGGVDDVRNGIALCKLHHWAFDNGWLSITDDCNIIVRDAEDRDGYDDFTDFDGDALHLPNDENLHPHPKFLQEHRSLHGFED